MANKWTRSAAFRFFNTEPLNPNWSWSARSADGRTVAVTLWKHEFGAGAMTYTMNAFVDWRKGNGSRQFLKDLVWARANCDGRVNVIVVVRDEDDLSRIKTKDCYPQKNLVMRVKHVDPDTGDFRLERVTPESATSSLIRPSAVLHSEMVVLPGRDYFEKANRVVFKGK